MHATSSKNISGMRPGGHAARSNLISGVRLCRHASNNILYNPYASGTMPTQPHFSARAPQRASPQCRTLSSPQCRHAHACRTGVALLTPAIKPSAPPLSNPPLARAPYLKGCSRTSSDRRRPRSAPASHSATFGESPPLVWFPTSSP